MTTLRVMTINLYGDNVDPDGLAEVLTQVDPDVLAVQELEAHAVAVITARFPHHGLDPATDALGSGIATRLPADLRRLPMPHRHGWTAVISADGNQSIQVVAVHLRNPLSWPWWRSATTRRGQLAAVERHLIATAEPILLVGDLNATTRWPAYRRLVGSAGFQDAALAAGTARPTWRLHGLGPPMLRIDHGLVRGLRAFNTMPVPVPGSDHLGLVIDVTLD